MNLLFIFLQQYSPDTGASIEYFSIFFMVMIVAITIFIAVKTNKGDDETSISVEQTNKVVIVNLTGGIIGLTSSSPQKSLNAKIKKENANGWKVIQVIPADSGNAFLFIFRLFLLLITCFLYTTVNGYYIIMEKKQ